MNQLSRVVDLGSRLSRGENEVEVEVATTLINRVRVANPDFATESRQDYGVELEVGRHLGGALPSSAPVIGCGHG